MVDELVWGIVAINGTRSGYKYGNEDSKYQGKAKGILQVGGMDGEDGENIM
jgi:hypothetical protein